MRVVTRMIKDQNKRTTTLYRFVHRIAQKLVTTVWLFIASSVMPPQEMDQSKRDYFMVK